MMSTKNYLQIVNVVSALLYFFDPDGMGSSVGAPLDEYDDTARLLVSQATGDVVDTRSLVLSHYSSASTHMVDSVVAALGLYLSAGQAPEGREPYE